MVPKNILNNVGIRVFEFLLFCGYLLLTHAFKSTYTNLVYRKFPNVMTAMTMLRQVLQLYQSTRHWKC